MIQSFRRTVGTYGESSWLVSFQMGMSCLEIRRQLLFMFSLRSPPSSGVEWGRVGSVVSAVVCARASALAIDGEGVGHCVPARGGARSTERVRVLPAAA